MQSVLESSFLAFGDLKKKLGNKAHKFGIMTLSKSREMDVILNDDLRHVRYLC